MLDTFSVKEKSLERNKVFLSKEPIRKQHEKIRFSLRFQIIMSNKRIHLLFFLPEKKCLKAKLYLIPRIQIKLNPTIQAASFRTAIIRNWTGFAVTCKLHSACCNAFF